MPRQAISSPVLARAAVVAAAATAVWITSPVARATNVSWNLAGGVAGNWSGAANWNPAAVPVAADYAIIQRLNGRVTLDVSPTTSLGFMGNEGVGTGILILSESGGARTWTAT